jgi:hypothetical protein
MPRRPQREVPAKKTLCKVQRPQPRVKLAGYRWRARDQNNLSPIPACSLAISKAKTTTLDFSKTEVQCGRIVETIVRQNGAKDPTLRHNRNFYSEAPGLGSRSKLVAAHRAALQASNSEWIIQPIDGEP